MSRIVLCVAALIAQTAVFAADLRLPPAVQNGFRIQGAPHSIHAIGVDANANIYIAGSFFGAIMLNTGFPLATKTILGPQGSPPSLFVGKISPSGEKLLYLTEIHDSDPSYNSLAGMAVTPDGSVILAGATRSSDFLTTEGSFQPRSANGGAFVLKLDPSGRNLVFSTYLDDSAKTGASTLHVDASGNAYLAGFTDGLTFPTTPGAYQTSVLPGPARPSSVGFVSKISADGKRLLFSSLFNESLITVMAVDASGAIHVAGDRVFAALDPTASRLIYSRELPDGSHTPLLGVDSSGNSYLALNYSYRSNVKRFNTNGTLIYDVQIPGAAFNALLVRDDGTVFAAGAATSVGFPTRDTLQPCNMNLPHDYVPVQWWVKSAAFTVLDPSGGIAHSSFLGGSAPAGYGNDSNTLSALAKGPDGSVYLVGGTASADFPGGATLISGPGTAFTFGLSVDLGTVDRGRPSPACLANAASSVEAPVIPAAFMTIFGSNLGPARGVGFSPDPDGRVPLELAGVRVIVGGLEAPVLYVKDQRIDFIVPHQVAGTTTDVCVNAREAQSCLFAYVGDVFPGIFRTGDGFSVLNEDGTLNTPSNAAPTGSVVSVFGTGFGPFDRQPPDGTIGLPPLGRLTHPLGATFFPSVIRPGAQESYAADILYAGAAPYLVHGVVQLNIRVPKNMPRGGAAVQLLVEGATVPRYRFPLAFGVSVK